MQQHIQKIILACAAAFSFSLSLALAQTPAPVTVQGGTLEEARAFIQRYLSSYDPQTVASVTIGGLPNLAFALPLPQGTISYGTVTRAPANPDATIPTYHEIYAQASGSARDLPAFFQQALGADWNTISTQDSSGGGFSPIVTSYGQFCRVDGSASMSFDATQLSGDSSSNLTLRIQVPSDVYVCSQSPIQPPVGPYDFMPSLSLPPNTRIGTFSGGGGDAESNMTVVSLLSDLTAEQLHAHYQAELKALGWEEISSQVSAESAASTWNLPMEASTYGASLSLVRGTKAGLFYATLIIGPR